VLDVRPRSRPLALRVGTVFDGRERWPGPHQVVVLDGGRVLSVGHEAPEGAEVIDLPEATALPGLIDTHVHLTLDASDDPVAGLRTADDETLLDDMAERGRRALRAGITTMRDLGDRDYLSLQLRGRSDLPTLLAAGPPVTTPGGHCFFLGGATTADEPGVRRAVREHAERGVDVVKVMASGGTLTPGTLQEVSQFAPEVLRVLVDEAHALGLPVTAHAHGTASIAESLAAGVDGLEHVTFWSESGVDDPGDLVGRIVASRVVVGATLGFDPPGEYAGLPEGLRRRLPLIDRTTARLREAGARVVVGSDAGVAPVKHHAVLPHAAVHLSSMGLGTLEVLATLTAEAALACGLGDSKGRLLPGHDADVLVVDGDPTRDLARLHDVRLVVRGGQIVDGAGGESR
jgi:imidazolonepropionase-like amidohydrolase